MGFKELAGLAGLFALGIITGWFLRDWHVGLRRRSSSTLRELHPAHSSGWLPIFDKVSGKLLARVNLMFPDPDQE